MNAKLLGDSRVPRIGDNELNASNYITIYIANNAIILYSVFLVCLSSHFEKLGQSDLDKKDSYKKL